MKVAAPLRRHVFTVDDWHRLGELGFFPPDARVELLDGEIAEYWIVDLAGDTVLVFSGPEGSAYRKTRVARPGEMLVPENLPAVSVAVSELLGLD